MKKSIQDERPLNVLRREFEAVPCEAPNRNKTRFIPVTNEILRFIGYFSVTRGTFTWNGALFESESIEESIVFISLGKIVQELKQGERYKVTVASSRVVVFDF